MTAYTVYHIGYLPNDRVHDPVLDELAEEYLERGTPMGHRTRVELGEDSPRGRGEGYLTQKRMWREVYEYRFTPKRGVKA